MSYNIQARAASKALVLAALAAAFDNVVSGQVQAKDKTTALAAGTAAVNSLADDDTRDVVVNVSGSLSWNGVLAEGESPTITACNVQANAYFAPRQ